MNASRSSALSVLFYGTPDFSVAPLQALLADPRINVGGVVTQPDRPAGRGRALQQSPVKVLASANKIPIIQLQSTRKQLAEFNEQVSKLPPFDIAVVVAFGQILPAQVLELPKAGSVNIHASLLPRWRGAAPIQRAILAGDLETGVALMKMDAGLDTGAVYAQVRVPIGSHTTSGDLHQLLSKVGAELLIEKIHEIAAGTIEAVPQSSEGITHAAKISNAEAEILWGSKAEEIDRLIRALNPFPGAYTYLEGQRVKIFAAEVLPEIPSPTRKVPGTVLILDKERLEIQTGDGVLAVSEAQIEGRKRMPIGEILRGASISAGTILGLAQNQRGII